MFFTLACCDLLSVKYGASTIRLFYVVCALLLPFYALRLKFPPSILSRGAFLFATLIPGALASIDVGRSMAYLLWILISIVVSYALVPQMLSDGFGSFRKIDRDALYGLLRNVYRFQIVVALALYLAGFDERPRFLYYEPSYFSISMSVYVNLVIHRWITERRGWPDFLLLLLYVVTAFSGAFLIVLCVSMLLNLSVRRGMAVAGFVLLTAAAFAVYVIYVEDLNTLLIRGIFNGSVDFYDILLRGGNRLSRFLVARDIFLQHPVLGVGIGAFESATADGSVDVYNDDTPWFSADGLPAVNIYMEILATTGLLGALGFLVFFWKPVRWIIGAGFASPIARSVACMLLVLNFESTYLRLYLWMALAICWFEYSVTVKKRSDGQLALN